MNSIKIEMGAVLALKNVIQLNDLMKEYINDNDKEPSWDGFIYLNKSDDMKAENIKYRIPVQVKGKNQEDLLKKQRISYPVEYKHLRNYYKDGGVFYVVVRFLYKGIIIKHNKTEPTYTKTSLFLCEKRRFFMGRTEKGGKVF